MICNPRELAAQQRGLSVIEAKTVGQVAKFAQLIPQEFADGLGKIANHSLLTCARHKSKILTEDNGGAWVGACGCANWCIECAKDPFKMVCLRSELGILPRDRDAEDGYVCLNCHEDTDKDFTPVRTDRVVQISQGVNSVIDGLHEAACAQEADPIAAVQDEAPPKVKKFSIQWFRNEAQSSLGPGADPETVEANAQEALAEHKQALAARRQERENEKNALKRVRELELELASEKDKRFKFERAFDLALAKGAAEANWDRDEVEDRIMEEIVDPEGLLEEDVEDLAAVMEDEE